MRAKYDSLHQRERENLAEQRLLPRSSNKRCELISDRERSHSAQMTLFIPDSTVVNECIAPRLLLGKADLQHRFTFGKAFWRRRLRLGCIPFLVCCHRFSQGGSKFRNCCLAGFLKHFTHWTFQDGLVYVYISIIKTTKMIFFFCSIMTECLILIYL